MLHITCTECGHDGAYYLVEITDDYVTLRCPCGYEFAITAAQQSEK